MEELANLPDKIRKEAQEAIDPAGVFARAKAQLEKERKKSDEVHAEFERKFFPLQEMIRILISAALVALISGFVALSIAYITWI